MWDFFVENAICSVVMLNSNCKVLLFLIINQTVFCWEKSLQALHPSAFRVCVAKSKQMSILVFSQPIKSNIYRVVLTRTHFFLKIMLKKFEDWTWMCPQRQTVFLNVLVTVSFWAVCSFNVGLSSGLFVFWSYSSQKSVREEPTGVKNIFCHLYCRNRPFEWSVKQPITSPVSNKVRLKSSNRRSKNIILSTPGGWQCVTDGQATQMCDFYSVLM